ncbi:MAG TPA: hypothetical protein VK834_04630 [Bradyrhizobium sp.]|jgi:hypothetical protein|nr:hypothetical protein [Bradyrhizobium sp.]
MSAAQDISISKNGASPSLAAVADIVLHRKKENSVMIKFGLIGAAAALLMVATPAMAKQRVDHTRYGYAQRLPRSVYNAYGFDRSSDVTPGNTSADFDRRNTFN